MSPIWFVLTLIIPAVADSGDTADTDTAPCPAASGRVVINEFLANPVGSDSTVDAEWIELYNTDVGAVDLEGWRLQVGTSSWSTKLTFGSGDQISALGFVTIGEANVTVDFTVGTLGMGNAGSNGDGVRLLDNNGDVVDTVVYGPNNNDAFEDDLCQVATTADTPGEGQALARFPDGNDTNDAQVDFALTIDVSPGSINPAPSLCFASTGQIVINELAPAAGGDGEWVELFNGSGSAVDLEDWELQWGTSGFASSYTFAAAQTLADGGYYVIGDVAYAGASDATHDLSMGNASSSGDAVRLVNASGAIIDTVLYGPNNSDGWLADDCSEPTVLAATPSASESLARRADGQDTDDSSVDFAKAPAPTPGAANPVVAVPSCTPSTGGLVINELVPDPDGADAGWEWIELKNTTSGTVSLEGWKIHSGGVPDSYGERVEIPVAVEIAAGDYLLIGGEFVVDADVVVELGLGNASSSAEGVRLVDCEGTVVDTVLYGPNNDDGFVEDDGAVAAQIPAAPKSGDSLARVTDGVDTDICVDDFAVSDTPSPGAVNPEIIPPVCVPTTGDIVINELLPNPAGSDSTALAEWVELYNGGNEDLTVDGWTLLVATQADEDEGNTESSKLTIPGGTIIEAGKHLLIGESNVVGVDVNVGGVFGLPSGSGGDAVVLRDCVGALVDVVVFGGANDDAIRDETGEITLSVAGKPGDDDCIARIQDGFDNDLSGTDFLITPDCTPGAANPFNEEVVCVPDGGIVKLNELVSNPAGDDEGFEFIELHNPSANDESVAGWGISIGTSGEEPFDEVAIRLPGGMVVPGNGYLVIGGSGVPESDYTATFSIGNGTSGDGVRLVDCEDNVVDTVVYGSNNDDLIPGDNGLAVETPVQAPKEAQALARKVDGEDSDDMTADWTVDPSPSPGATNIPEPGDPSDDPVGCGARGEVREGGAKTSGCAVTPAAPPEFAWMMLGLLVAFTRRR